MPSSCYVQVCSNYANRNSGISLHLNLIENKNRVVWVWFVNTHWAHFNPMGRFVICRSVFLSLFPFVASLRQRTSRLGFVFSFHIDGRIILRRRRLEPLVTSTYRERKLIERAVQVQICKNLSEHKILSHYQCGFRKAHSTEFAAHFQTLLGVVSIKDRWRRLEQSS